MGGLGRSVQLTDNSGVDATQLEERLHLAEEHLLRLFLAAVWVDDHCQPAGSFRRCTTHTQTHTLINNVGK